MGPSYPMTTIEQTIEHKDLKVPFIYSSDNHNLNIIIQANSG